MGLQFISPLEAIKDVGLMVKTSKTGQYAFQVSTVVEDVKELHLYDATLTF